MYISIFDLFKIGIGPSSSHTVGPINSSNQFIKTLDNNNIFNKTEKIKVELFGSLAFTGKGHGTDKAIIIGLMGFTPTSINPKETNNMVLNVKTKNKLILNQKKEINFNFDNDIKFNLKEKKSYHSNAILFTAYNNNEIICKELYYSIGGGFIIKHNELSNQKSSISVPFMFNSSKELLELCKKNNFTIYELMMQNELIFNSDSQIKSQIKNIWDTMNNCIDNGIKTKGLLDGKLQVKRRAPDLYNSLKNSDINDPLTVMDWVNLFAISICEENASGGKIVTAPTNGAAGIIPAVIKYYLQFTSKANQDGISKFLLTAAAIGMLYKNNASISGAEAGCQGEVGVACSMAAAGLTAALDGSNKQIENAAEIGMEHNLGLTCDPVGGLVQVPCIERNAMGAIKAINASRIALRESGDHKVSLDQVIATMKQTGIDMQSIYKETSKGGLAVNVVEC